MSDHHTTQGNKVGAEPIAVIGMGCRLPGAAGSPAEFWDLLARNADLSSDLPENRWADHGSHSADAAAMRDTVRRGSFLDDIAGFDAAFFGVLPREAELMDPQQRILLEVTWEALENAGVPPTSLAGTDAGVYIGVVSNDYERRLLEDLPRIEAWSGIGTQMCGMSNRISYALDLRGPSMSIDTACSASLVALHLACTALRADETSLAVVGGANVIAGPGLTVMLDAAGALAPDGRCKPFDASADGYGRGEGAGVVVLKRLSDALRDGDHVRAVIKGSAVHQDGRTNGILAPSDTAQISLLRKAYAAADVDPVTVDYVEGHITGTPAGDPMEVAALSSVLGAGRAAGAPCLVGSVKGNIGHLEGAAGVVSLIKTVLSVERGQIPPTLIATELDPGMPWEDNGLRVVTEPTPWPRTGQVRRAAVSGFGYGGTLAHVVLEQAPERAAARRSDVDGRAIFPLSGATVKALRANAAAVADWLEQDDDTPLPAIGHTLSARRAQLEHRAAVVAADRHELAQRLRSLARGGHADGVETGSPVPGADAGPVWVFSGHGSQWPGMGRELLDREPAFAAVIDDLADVFRDEIGFTPRECLLHDPLEDVDVVQPMIFAVQVGLAAVWREYGVEPSAVIGHSVGEIAAAVTAGALSLEDGARLICRRSVLLRRVAGKGAMAMVNLPFSEAERRLADVDGVVAAISAAQGSTVVSGDIPAVRAIVGEWRAEGLDVRDIPSDVAFHSPQMDELLSELSAAGHDLLPGAPKTPLYTTAMDDPRAVVSHDGPYWAANLRNPVRFTAAVLAAAEDGYRVFLEVSGHPVVTHSIVSTLDDARISDVRVIGTLRRNAPEQEALLGSLGALHCHGVTVEFDPLFPDRELAELPTTAWQHRTYWRAAEARPHVARQHDVDSHTLLGAPVTVVGETPLRLWQSSLDFASRPYPGNHPVHGVEIVPAAVLLHTFQIAARAEDSPVLSRIDLRAPISLSARRDVQITLQNSTLRLASRIASDSHEDSWLTNTAAVVGAAGAMPAPERLPLVELRGRCPEELPDGFIPELLASIAVPAMGFPWRVEELRRAAGNELYAVVSSGLPEPAGWASLLDAALTLPTAVFPGEPTLRMPAEIGQLVVSGDAPQRAVVHVRIADPDAAEVVTVRIADLDGRVLLAFDDLRFAAPEITPMTELGPTGRGHDPADLLDEPWAGLAGDALRDFVAGEVRTLVADVTKLPADDVNTRKPLVEQGLDSVMTLILRRSIETAFPIRLPGTLLWDHPTVAAIAEHVAEQLPTVLVSAA